MHLVCLVDDNIRGAGLELNELVQMNISDCFGSLRLGKFLAVLQDK